MRSKKKQKKLCYTTENQKLQKHKNKLYKKKEINSNNNYENNSENENSDLSQNFIEQKNHILNSTNLDKQIKNLMRVRILMTQKHYLTI